MAAVVAYGAVSSLGEGRAAFDVGGAGQKPHAAWSARGAGKLFGRALTCTAPRAERPRALLELGLAQVVSQLNARGHDWSGARLGVVIGTSSGGFAALERALAAPDATEIAWAESAYFSPLSALQRALGKSPQRLVSLYAACASSTLALGLGLRWLEMGEVDLVIAGGYDAESDWVCAGFDALKATCAAAPRPFRAERDGMALGEGVALVALERSAPHAFGFLRGFGATTDAVHITAPDRTGHSLARAGQQALDDASLTAAQVDFVSVHGTGTSFNDAAEAAALGGVFGDRAAALGLHAFKSVVGHTLGAAGALEALAALSALENGVVPASASLGTPMPGLRGRLLDENAAGAVQHCLKLSTAFGGANAALVLSNSDVPRAPRPRRPVYVAAVGVPCASFELSRVESLLRAPLERLPRSDTLSLLAVAAAAEALRNAAERGVELDRARTGVLVGSVGASLEANAEFASRILGRGPSHAEPRRFPATSPNACAGHVAIAFGLGGLSHSVGAGAGAALEALAVARDWLAAGDADALLVIAAEQTGSTARRVLAAQGLQVPEQGSFALLLSTSPAGPPLDEARLSLGTASTPDPEMAGFMALAAFCAAAGLPGPGAFGSVRPPE